MNDITLVIGGTGKTGRRVVERLEQRGMPVRIAARSTGFDWNDASTWAKALEGVRAIYVTYAPDLALPSAAPAVAALLAQAGHVQRIVLLSGRGEPETAAAEEACKAAGIPWTIVKPSFFAQNFSEGAFADEVRSGVFAFPAGQTAEPFVDLEDVADVVVAALLDEVHIGKTYELTGPRLLTFDDVASELSRALPHPVRYAPVSVDAYASALAQVMPPEEATWLATLFGNLLDGHNASLTGDVAKILGRPPRDFRTYAEQAFGGQLLNVGQG